MRWTYIYIYKFIYYRKKAKIINDNQVYYEIRFIRFIMVYYENSFKKFEYEISLKKKNLNEKIHFYMKKTYKIILTKWINSFGKFE